MKIKSQLMIFALMSACATTVNCAKTKIEEVNGQLGVLNQKLHVLGEMIMKLDENIVFFDKKRCEFRSKFIEAKKREHPGTQFTEKELNDAFKDEWVRFVQAVNNSTSRTDSFILNDEFFHGIEGASHFKFYMIKYAYDQTKRDEFLSQWDRLNNEYVALTMQFKQLCLESGKEL